MKKAPSFLISCEHATKELPEEWAYIFKESMEVLDTHLGWDPGALRFAEIFAKSLAVKLYHYPWSRLLIEPNRSLYHTSLFSEFTKVLTRTAKNNLVETYWKPYRKQIHDEIRRKSVQSKVIHISVHSFTPQWENEERKVDIGLLYDPKRKAEKHFCNHWKNHFKHTLPDMRIRMNQPYTGSSDGLTTSLRREFNEEQYLGIEIEINQKYWFRSKKKWEHISNEMVNSLMRMID